MGVDFNPAVTGREIPPTIHKPPGWKIKLKIQNGQAIAFLRPKTLVLLSLVD